MRPLFFTEGDILATLRMNDALRLVDDAARKLGSGGAMNAARMRVSAGGAMLNVLPAALDGRTAFKAYTIGPRGAKFWVTLYDADGVMLALMEANHLGQIRTGAASGVASRYLARPDSRVLGTIGTGFQARTQIEAICLAMPAIEHVIVWGRNPDRLATFCGDVEARIGRSVTPATSPHAAIAGADIVVTMTSAAEPVFDGTSLRPGTHINAAGSNRPTASEIDVETVRRAAVVTVEDVAQAQREAGDLIAARTAGAFDWDAAIPLPAIVAGTHSGRTRADQITLFESLGIGLWDIAVAAHVYDACVAAGRGAPLPVSG